MKYAWLIIAVWLVLGANGCSDCPSSKDGQSRIVDKARQIALAGNLNLSQKEIEVIKNEKPNIQLYPMDLYCDEIGDYSISWEVNNERIVIHGSGNIYEQSDANASRIYIQIE